MTKIARQQGFTLIETIVVIIIIAIITTIAVVAFSGFGENRRISIAAQKLAATLAVAEQQAILQPAIVGVVFQQKSYHFMQLTQDEDNAFTWRQLDIQALAKTQMPRNVKLALLKVAGQAPQQSQSPQISFLPSGNVTPFVVKIYGRGKLFYDLIVKQDGSIKLSSSIKTKNPKKDADE